MKLEKKHILIGLGAIIAGCFLFGRKKSDEIGSLEDLDIEGVKISDLKKMIKSGECGEINGGEITIAPDCFILSKKVQDATGLPEVIEALADLSTAIKALRKIDKAIIINRNRFKRSIAHYANPNAQMSQIYKAADKIAEGSGPYERGYILATMRLAAGKENLKWKKRDDNDKKKGVKEMFGWGEGERRRMMNNLASKGKKEVSPEAWCDSFEQYDDDCDDAARGAEEALRQHPSPGLAKKALLDIVQDTINSEDQMFAGMRTSGKYGELRFGYSPAERMKYSYDNYMREYPEDAPF